MTSSTTSERGASGSPAPAGRSATRPGRRLAAGLLGAAGFRAPGDREIDGVDQLPWLTGQEPSSRRDGYLYWMGPELYGVKWRHFKLALVAQTHSTDPPQKLSSPRIINLVADPHEREAFDLPHLHSWAAVHFNRLLGAFHASTAREAPIPAGAALDYAPSGG